MVLEYLEGKTLSQVLDEQAGAAAVRRDHGVGRACARARARARHRSPRSQAEQHLRHRSRSGEGPRLRCRAHLRRERRRDGAGRGASRRSTPRDARRRRRTRTSRSPAAARSSARCRTCRPSSGAPTTVDHSVGHLGVRHHVLARADRRAPGRHDERRQAARAADAISTRRCRASARAIRRCRASSSRSSTSASRSRRRERYQNATELLARSAGVPRAEGRARDRRGSCPYRGLAAFGEDDAKYFFGRSNEIRTALAQLEAWPLLAVIGPSGVGKSSFVHAGLVPGGARAPAATGRCACCARVACRCRASRRRSTRRIDDRRRRRRRRSTSCARRPASSASCCARRRRARSTRS